MFINFKQRGLVQEHYDSCSFNLKVIVDLSIPFDYLITLRKAISVSFKLKF